MAKRTSRTTRTATRTRAPREPKATSRKARTAPTADVEVVEESSGADIDTGIAVITTIVLVAAFLFVDAIRGQYGEGLFF